MGIQHNANQVAAAIEARGPRVEAELIATLDRQVQEIARAMKRHAPTFQSTLVNSVHVEAPSPFVRVIAPGVDHGVYQERGIKPGGKGLPRFMDPASASIVAWLQSKTGGLPKNVGKRQSFELSLRDRYEGLAWHVRHHGMKAHPFVKPAFDEKVNNVASALRAAVARGLSGGAA